MDIYVTAEFDSVDLADLASGRVRNLPGVTGVDVIPKHSSERDGGYEAALPFWQVPGSANLSFFSMSTLYPVPVGVGLNYKDDVEPNLNREAILKVRVDDENVCPRVTSILRSIGGRSIKVVNSSKK